MTSEWHLVPWEARRQQLLTQEFASMVITVLSQMILILPKPVADIGEVQPQILALLSIETGTGIVCIVRKLRDLA